MLQTILGAGGAIGVQLARVLPEYTDQIRLVSRNPEKVNPSDELMPADLLDPRAVDKAIEGASIAYITVGFPYKASVWKEVWPAFIQNAIDACVRHNCKMVFFDNVYMYDPSHMGNMTEETPINPSSKKGKVRKEVAERIMNKVASGELTALIARSADFYGPNIGQNCVLNETVIKPLSTGKKATWLGNMECRHAYTYTPDAARAVAMLGNTADAYGEVWHMPTAAEPPTGKEWIEMIASAFDAKPSGMSTPKFMVHLMGLFVPVMREIPEMMYQNDRDYVFHSDKFEKRFNLKPTPYREGIKAVLAADYGITQ